MLSVTTDVLGIGTYSKGAFMQGSALLVLLYFSSSCTLPDMPFFCRRGTANTNLLRSDGPAAPDSFPAFCDYTARCSRSSRRHWLKCHACSCSMKPFPSLPLPTPDTVLQHSASELFRFLDESSPCPSHAFFFNLTAFFLLLRIMTIPRKLPTTAQPRRIRMTGMRIAQTRGGKRDCRGWS